MIDKQLRKLVADIAFKVEGLDTVVTALSTKVRHLTDDICDSCTATFQYDSTVPRSDTRLCRLCLEKSVDTLEAEVARLVEENEELRQKWARIRAASGR